MTAVHSYMTIDGFAVLDPGRLSAEAHERGLSDAKWNGRANSVTLSGGMEPASSFLLVSSDTMSKLDVNEPHEIALFCEPRGTSEDDEKWHGLDKFTLPGWYIHRAESVLAGASDVKGPFVLELRDPRQIYKMSAVHQSYNVTSPDEANYWNITTNSTVPWEWDTMIDDLTDKVPFRPAVDHTEANYPTWRPEQFRFQGCSAWGSISRALSDVQNIMLPKEVLDKEEWTWQITHASWVHEPNVDMKATLLDPAYIPAIRGTRAPAEYMVVFPDRDYMYQADTDTAIFDSHDTISAFPTHAEFVAIPGGVPGTQIAIHDAMPVRRDAISGGIINGTDISQRASQVANQHHGRLIGADRDDVYGGLYRFMPDGDIGAVTWFDHGGGWMTRIQHGPRAFRRFHPYHYVPEIVEEHLPVHRKIVGEVTSQEAIGGSKTGTAKVQYIAANGGWADATPIKTFGFRNVGYEDIVQGDRIYAEWWWQKKEWIAFCGFRPSS